MDLHEKTLELNITHELLNLADSWYWFLTDIPLWRYWRPRYKLPFLKYPKSTAGGFHITTEGKNDATGEAGGGYDVRIKAGFGGYLLFIQFKLGELITTSPNPKSIFDVKPYDHYKFKINSTKTNQHFLLKSLADGIGKEKGNAVVYAFPLISNMSELEIHSGKLIRKTKFISIKDIDDQANLSKVVITKNQEHNFRVGRINMNRCEVSSDNFSFNGEDKTLSIITDIIALRFYETLSTYIDTIEKNYKIYKLDVDYISEGIQRSFVQYLRYLLHYFEVNPYGTGNRNLNLFLKYSDYQIYDNEFSEYLNNPRDIEIVSSVFNALSTFEGYIRNSTFVVKKKMEINFDIPIYRPTILISLKENGIQFNVNREYSREELENIMYLVI